MYRVAIAEYVSIVEEYVAKQRGHMETIIGERATARDIIACEQSLGQALPRDFVQFLLECNGFKSTLYGPRGIKAYELEIFGTTRLVEQYRKMLDYVDEHSDSIALDDAREFIVFSGPESNPNRYLFHRTVRHSDRFEVVFRAYPNGWWLTDNGSVAESFDEHFTKALDFMKRGFGFFYHDGIERAENIRDY